MSWQPELDELKQRQEFAKQLGGTEKVDRHRANGKLTVRERIDGLVDKNSFSEIGSITGKGEYDAQGNIVDSMPTNVVCGSATIEKRPVFVTGDDFTVRGGANDGGLAEKFAFAETYARRWRIPLVRLVDLAQTFHLPVVHLIDIPGFLISTAAEAGGVMRAGSQALVAFRQSTVPWCAILVRKAFGMAGLTQRNGSEHFTRYSWPSAQWGSLPIAGGVQAAYRTVIEAAEDPDKTRAEIEAKLKRYESPMRAAEAFGVEEIIDPRDTRARLSAFAAMAAPLRQTGRSNFGYRP